MHGQLIILINETHEMRNATLRLFHCSKYDICVNKPVLDIEFSLMSFIF